MNDVRIEKWEQDLDQLAESLPINHKNLFHTMKRDFFYQRIAQLKSELNTLDNIEILVNICKIVAAARDAHTSVLFPARDFLPFKVYWFEEGIYILAAASGQTGLINCRVERINGIEINHVVKLFKEVISYENELFFRSQFPDYMCAVDILYGLEIVDETDKVELDLMGIDGNLFRVVVPSISSESYHGISTEADFDTDDRPLYRKIVEKPYWSHMINNHKTLYFNYNRCKEMKADDFGDFTESLMNQIEKNDVERLILDLRNNRGGNSTLLEPFIDKIRKCEKINQEGCLFVIIGRDTFSSALLNAFALKSMTKATFIGEPSGGKPNCYGEVQHFKLSNSKVGIRYSTKYYKLINDDTLPSLYPDVQFLPTFQDFIENRDPCLDYILASPNRALAF